MIITQENGTAVVGSVFVKTVDNRGLTPEEIADTAVDKIVSVGDQSHPVIREQALAFKENVRQVLVFYIKESKVFIDCFKSRKFILLRTIIYFVSFINSDIKNIFVFWILR